MLLLIVVVVALSEEEEEGFVDNKEMYEAFMDYQRYASFRVVSLFPALKVAHSLHHAYIRTCSLALTHILTLNLIERTLVKCTTKMCCTEKKLV